MIATHRCTKWTCSSDWMVAVCVCGLFLRSSISVTLSTSCLVYRRRRNERNTCMDHHHPPSYLSVVLRPLPCSHLPLHTLLPNTPLSWLHPPSSIQNLLKWNHPEKRRHGYALDVHYELLYIYSVLSSVSLSHGSQAICTLRTL